MEAITTLPIKDIAFSATNPRKYFDKKEMKDLQGSIKTHGVIQPIIVRAVGAGYELIAGERRMRASMTLDLGVIPAIIRALDDAEMLEVQVIENLQRADVHPLDEAEGYAQLAALNVLTIKGIAERVGKPQPYVAQRMQLANLIKPFKKIFWADGMTVTHAIHIARLDEAGQEIVLKWHGKDERMVAVSQLVRFIDDSVLRDIAKAPWKKDDAELDAKAGACSACPKRSGANKALFDDMGKSDMCLDSDCFKSKAKLFVAGKLAEAEENEETLVQISTNYDTKLKGVIPYADYHSAQKSNPKAIEALVVEGTDVGRTVYILSSKVKADDGPKLTEAERVERAATRVKNQKENIERVTRIDTVSAVAEKVNTKLASDDISTIALALFVSMSNHDRKVFVTEFLGKEDAGFSVPRVDQFKKLAPKTDFEMNKFLVTMALSLSVDSTLNSKLITDAATRFKVDVKKIKSAVETANPITYPKAYVGPDAPKVEVKKAA